MNTGACVQVSAATSPHVWNGLMLGDRIMANLLARLSTPAIQLRGVNIGVCHFRLDLGTYVHLFFAFEPVPPFAILSVSKTFRLLSGSPDPRDSSSVQHQVEYIAGMYTHAGRVILTYGAADAHSAETSISEKELFALLNDREARWPFCLPKVAASVCDDRTCSAAGPIVAICPTMCTSFPWSCDSLKKYESAVGRAVGSISLDAQHRFDRASTAPKYRHNRSLWAMDMIAVAKASLISNSSRHR